MAKKKAKSAKKPGKATKKKSAAAARTATKPPKKKASKRPVPSAAKSRPEDEPSLGRPKVTGEELLYMLFREDYHARQIFDFLKVERVKELEEYSPHQIVKLLSKPITDTVNRIRRKLAEKNRALRDDREFAAEQKLHE